MYVAFRRYYVPPRLFRIKAYIKHPSADLDKQMQLATETDENFYLHQQHQVIALHSIMHLFQYNYSSVSEALSSHIQGYHHALLASYYRYNLIDCENKKPW